MPLYVGSLAMHSCFVVQKPEGRVISKWVCIPPRTCLDDIQICFSGVFLVPLQEIIQSLHLKSDSSFTAWKTEIRSKCIYLNARFHLPPGHLWRRKDDSRLGRLSALLCSHGLLTGTRQTQTLSVQTTNLLKRTFNYYLCLQLLRGLHLILLSN